MERTAEGQLGVRGRVCARGRWAPNGVRRAVGTAPVLEFEECLHTVLRRSVWVVLCQGRGSWGAWKGSAPEGGGHGMGCTGKWARLQVPGFKEYLLSDIGFGF